MATLNDVQHLLFNKNLSVGSSGVLNAEPSTAISSTDSKETNMIMKNQEADECNNQ